ncbi:hypothetical protein ABID56_000305 [Alkalibacillus flavidus]|uniref:Sporulation inhibitor of replication protein SirA n=1 Tax=Alkalibacillus flavidus TaxID=546021 RepID=A0ABV2KUE4_9BACI
MYQYSLYFFEPDYAYHFYYKVDVLYRFIKEQLHEPQTDTSKRQADHILVKPDCHLVIDQLLTEEMDKSYLELANDQFELKNSDGNITVQQHGYALTVFAPSLLEADAIVFEAIKRCYRYTFVVNFQTEECGWVLPLTNRSFELN